MKCTHCPASTLISFFKQALVLENRSSWIPFFTTASHIQTINVPLVESWSPALQPGVLTSTGVAIARGTTQKGFHAFVAVGRPDSWKSLGNGQGKELSIARAVLHGRVQLSGFRYSLSLPHTRSAYSHIHNQGILCETYAFTIRSYHYHILCGIYPHSPRTLRHIRSKSFGRDR